MHYLRIMMYILSIAIVMAALGFGCGEQADTAQEKSEVVLLTSPADFRQLPDIADDYGASFMQKVVIDQDLEFEIIRKHIDGPYYDGIPGYNVLAIREYKAPVIAGPKEVYTQLAKGQYHLFGFDPNNQLLYAYRCGQTGSAFSIRDIMVFGPRFLTGHTLGIANDKSAAFQYGSPSPDGRFCLLIGRELTVVNLSNGEHSILEFHGNIPFDAASPAHQTETGSVLGGDYSLTDEYLEMVWDTPTSGKLLVRDINKELIREIPISIEQALLDAPQL